MSNILTPYRYAAAEEENLLTIIKRHHGDTGIEQVHDLGSASSYDPGVDAQTLFDLKNSNDAWRGADGTSTTNDWTFNGTAGSLNFTNYALHDGGDFSRLKTQPAYIENFHKDSAVWTFMASCRIPDMAGQRQVYGNFGGGLSNVGSTVGISATEKLIVQILNGSAEALNATSTASIPIGSDCFVAVAIDEAAGTGTLMMDATQESFTSTYTSPSAANATFTTEIAAGGNAALIMPNTFRLYGAAFLSEKVSDADLASIRTDYNART